MQKELDSLSPLLPIDFFEVRHTLWKLPSFSIQRVQEKKYLLPTSTSLQRSSSTKIWAGWSEEGLAFSFQIETTQPRSVFPHIEKGDGIELFIDTRGLDLGVIHPFCHRFLLFFTQVVSTESISYEEKMHPSHQIFDLTASTDETEHHRHISKASIEVHRQKSRSTLSLLLPRESLNGYRPNNPIRLYYVVHRFGESAEKGASFSEGSAITSRPYLWTYCYLKEEEKR